MAFTSQPHRSQATPSTPAFAPVCVLRRTVRHWLYDESGATAVEYSMLLVFMGLAILAAMVSLSGGISGVANTLSTTLAGM